MEAEAYISGEPSRNRASKPCQSSLLFPRPCSTSWRPTLWLCRRPRSKERTSAMTWSWSPAGTSSSASRGTRKVLAICPPSLSSLLLPSATSNCHLHLCHSISAISRCLTESMMHDSTCPISAPRLSPQSAFKKARSTAPYVPSQLQYSVPQVPSRNLKHGTTHLLSIYVLCCSSGTCPSHVASRQHDTTLPI